MLKIINIICILLVIIIVLCILESIRENNKFYIKEYNVSHAKVPASFDNTHLAIIADWHNACFGKDNSNFIEKIKSLQPDYILIAGDMIVCRNHTADKVRRTARMLKQISEIAPVYYAYGNHEFGVREQLHDTEGLWDIYTNELDLKNHTNIHMLDNERIVIDKDTDKICISGLTLDREYFKRFVIKQLDKDMVNNICCEDGAFNILLAHNPDYFNTYADAGADLVFSGHNHGGMIRLPILGGVISPRFHIFPKYDRGFYNKDDSIMILSGGLGTHSVPIRVNNIPEILSVQLHNIAK